MIYIGLILHTRESRIVFMCRKGRIDRNDGIKQVERGIKRLKSM
jgi:hypothetical protein